MATCVEWTPRFPPSPQTGLNVDFAITSKCIYLEMLHYPGIPHPVQAQGELRDKSLSKWLSKVLTLPSQF